MHLLALAALLITLPQVQSTAPDLQPQLASEPGLTAVAFGSGDSVWIALSQDDGRSFSQPAEVARLSGLALRRHRGPRVSISGRTLVVTAVNGDGNLVAWRSADRARTWSQPVVVNDCPGSAREGLHAVAAGSGGQLAAVWLDGRSKRTELYGAYSADSGVTWSKNVLIYRSPGGAICSCCDPSIASAGSGRFEVMFRNVMNGFRDLYLAEWRPGQLISEPQKLGVGSWKLNACPMDGGGVARYGNTTVTAWRRDRSVYLDAPGQPETAVGEGTDVSLALSRAGPYVAWTDGSGVALKVPGAQSPLHVAAAGKFPALTALPDGSVLLAWEDSGRIELQSFR